MARYTHLNWVGLCLLGVFSSAALLSPVLISSDARAEILTPLAAHAPLSLTCYGEGEIRQAGAASTPETRKTRYHGYVELRLFDGNDRIQLPQGFRSTANSHDDGWYKVKNLKASDDDIIGNAIISFIDKPFFRAELFSGRIDISGLSGTFAGECRKIGF